MEILYFLIPVSLVIIALAVAVFFWAVKSGQYDDLEGPAYRILFDDDQPVENVRERKPEEEVSESQTPAGKDQG